MNPRLHILLESRDLLEHSVLDDEVLALWSKASQMLENSRRGLDPLVEFTLAYTAALQAASALLAAFSYRASGRDHHHNVFAGVRALSEGDLSRAANTLDELRLGRHEAVYGYQQNVSEADMEALRDVQRPAQ